MRHGKARCQSHLAIAARLVPMVNAICMSSDYHHQSARLMEMDQSTSDGCISAHCVDLGVPLEVCCKHTTNPGYGFKSEQ